MSAMGTIRPLYQAQRAPSFFWHGLLILAPVVVLTAIGATALWKERRLALREAEARGQEIAEAAAQDIWKQLATLNGPSNGSEEIEFDRHGNLIHPRPY